MDPYEQRKRAAIRGWNTWHMRSLLSHVHMPEGFAVNLCVKDAQRSSYLKEADVGSRAQGDAIVFPGPHAFDGSYTELTLEWHELKMQVRSCTSGDDLILLVTPLCELKKGLTLIAETGLLWSRQGELIRTETSVGARCGGREFALYATEEPACEPYAIAQTPYLAFILNGEIGLCTGKKRALSDIRALVSDAAAGFMAKAPYEGDLRDAYMAMQTCLAWDTIYDPMKNRMISTVSRRWDKFWSGYVLFCWDTYFAAAMASVCSKEIAYANLIEITAEKTESGFVPNFASSIGASSRDRSQPPVGARALLDTYRRWGEKWIIERLYPDLLVWNTWWFEHRQIEPGLFAWGSDPFKPHVNHYSEIQGVNERFGAALESGLDNSPMYDDIPFDSDRHMLMLADAGLTGLVIMDCRAMRELAEIIGDTAARDLMDERLALCEPAVQALWSEEDGFFCNLRTDTREFSKRFSPTNFFALYSSSVTDEQCRRVIDEHFYNENEFWGDYIMPSISRNDPAFPEQDYWRGRIWAPLNYIVYGALKDRGLRKPARDLAERSLALLLKEWREKGHVHENYCALTGEGCNVLSSDAFYHWGGLLALIAICDRENV